MNRDRPCVTNRGKMHRSYESGVTKEGTVPLSEHEQRLLDQIEQALYADDPKFAATVRSARSGRVRTLAGCSPSPSPAVSSASPWSCRPALYRASSRSASSDSSSSSDPAASPPSSCAAGRPRPSRSTPASPGDPRESARAWRTGSAAASTRADPPVRRRLALTGPPLAPSALSGRAATRATAVSGGARLWAAASPATREAAARGCASPGAPLAQLRLDRSQVVRSASSPGRRGRRRCVARLLDGRGEVLQRSRVARPGLPVEPVHHLARRARRGPHVAQIDGGVARVRPTAGRGRPNAPRAVAACAAATWPMPGTTAQSTP